MIQAYMSYAQDMLYTNPLTDLMAIALVISGVAHVVSFIKRRL